MSTVRTSEHYYPMEEVEAMSLFYGGKKCVITLNPDTPIWAHTMDADLDSSESQLQWMLQRNLRQDRHPRHAAEVRENIIPLGASEHRLYDFRSPLATLFLHEDVLALTLKFEREVKDWRLLEIQAGRGDPARPSYEYAFMTAQGTQIVPTPHRWFASEICRGTFARIDVVFRKEQCPGIDPPHANPFPVILTLLSIPFSVLYNLPRLSGLVTSSPFRCDLANMALEIVSLWAWDPPPVSVKTPKTSIKRSQPPLPIFHASRNATFANMRPRPSIAAVSATSYAAATSGVQRVLQAESGEFIIEIPPREYFYDGALTTIPPDNDVNEEKERVWHVSTTSSFYGSAFHRFGSTETQTSDTGSNSSDRLESNLDVSLQARVAAWLEDVGKETLEPLPAMSDTGPFTPGVIGGMTINDILMVKGLINPSVYVQFYNLSLYS